MTERDKERLYRDLIEIYRDIEDELTREIASRLRVDAVISDIDKWRVDKLQEMGMLRRNAVRTIAEMSGRTTAEVERILRDYGYRVIEPDEKIYKQHYGAEPVPAQASLTIQNILATSIKRAKAYMNMVNTTALERSMQTFQRIVNTAYLEVVTGSADYITSIRRSVTRLADDGITGMTYRSAAGRTTEARLEVAVRRAIITSMNQTAGQMQHDRMNAWGVELVEVSNHLGARPSHAEWQGKIYSLNGATAQYPNLAAATGYGTGEGLYGWNCRHDMYPYIEGVSEPAARQYTQAENDKVYAETQEQRRLERLVRQEKRRVIAAQETGDKEMEMKAQAKLDLRDAELKAYARKIGQMYQVERTEVRGYTRSMAADEMSQVG